MHYFAVLKENSLPFLAKFSAEENATFFFLGTESSTLLAAASRMLSRDWDSFYRDREWACVILAGMGMGHVILVGMGMRHVILVGMGMRHVIQVEMEHVAIGMGHATLVADTSS